MTVYKYEKNGQILYKFRVSLGFDPITGKQIKRQKSGYRTKKAAMIAEEKMKENHLSYDDENRTFESLYSDWIKTYELKVKPATFNRTKTYFKLQILPYFKNVKVKDVKHKDAQKFVIDMSKEYKKFKEIASYTKQVFNYAIILGIIDRNPFEYITYPKVERETKETVVLTKDELLEQLKYMKKYFNFKWFTFFNTLAFTGLRRGEIIALKWADLSFKFSSLSINKTVTLDKNGKQIVSNSTKTDKSTRIIKLSKFVLDNLEILYKSKNSEWIFPNKKGEVMNITTPYKELQKFYKNHPDLKKLSIHEFRHNYATLLRNANIDYKAIRDILGHTSSIFTLNKYIHSNEDIERKNVEEFEKFIEN